MMLGVLLALFGLGLAAGASGLPFPANVDLAGGGINSRLAAIDGDPSCVDTTCASPGFMAPIFNMSSATRGHSWNGLLSVPDGWAYVPDNECRFFDKVDIIHDWEDYKSTVTAYTHTEHHSLFHHSSSSKWFEAINEWTLSRETVLTRHTANCLAYRLEYDPFQGPAQFAPGFQELVSSLPVLPSEYSAKMPQLLNFVQTYGDAFLRSIVLGAKSVVLSVFKQDNFTRLQEEGGDLHSSASLDHLCRLGDDVLCNPDNPRLWDQRQRFANASLKVYTSYLPVQVQGMQAGHADQGWAKALTSPAVIDYDLGPIAEVGAVLRFGVGVWRTSTRVHAVVLLCSFYPLVSFVSA